MMTPMPPALVPELPVYRRLDLNVVAGDGARLRTDDGRELVDFYGGHAVTQVGYGDTRLADALARQARALIFQTNAVHHAGRDDAIARLVAFAPPGLERAFLVNSGAEANENALRLAFRWAAHHDDPRTCVVAVEGGFHGRTAAAAACGPGADAAWYGFPRSPFDVVTVPFGDIDAMGAAVDTRTAAVILEPVQGVAGARALSGGFIRAAREAATNAGALLIADEVQCGMGRTGMPFAIEASGVTPDILTTAKGLGGGFPTGAVLTSGAISDILGPGHLGTTFGGGPLAAAAIKAVLDALDDDRLAHVRAMSERIRAALPAGVVTAVQGRGLLLGLRTMPLASEVRDALLAKDVLVGTSADPHVIRLTPPLVIGPDDVDVLLGALQEISA